MTSSSTIHSPQLLSPAGDKDAMRAAVANGADAVYFGLDNFNARHRATNFTLDELPATMDYLHAHNVLGFVTFNTLIFSDELHDAVEYARRIASAGVDAVIVQDLGLVRLIRALAPELPIHGSTQMTLTEPRGIEFVRSLGVQRVVLARELSVDDIRRVKRDTTMALEVFIHGALCVAYSGQCLTSEALGGRSANRGQCAQACRLPYDLMVDGGHRDLGDKAYLLSPQDLAAYELVDELSEIGVSCFKIEGRLKSPHYVAATTQTYRHAIDAAGGMQPFAISPQQRGDLEQTFSRGFTHGFLSGVNHQALVSARFPKSRGVRVGTVESTRAPGIVVHVERPDVSLKPGDGVVFDEGHPEQDEQGGRVFSVRELSRGKLELRLGRGDVNLAAINPGAIVWKTDDPAIRKRLEHSFSRDTVFRRRPVDAEVSAIAGEKLRVTFTCGGRSATVESALPLDKADRHPATSELIREQLARLGDTPFELREVRCRIEGAPMAPKSVLNSLRRDVVARLRSLESQRRADSTVGQDVLSEFRSQLPARADAPTSPSLFVLVRTLEQLGAVLNCRSSTEAAMVYCDFEDIRKHQQAVEMCRRERMPVALATLRVVKPGEDGLLQQVLDCAPDAVLVRNLAAVSFFRERAPSLPQIGDYSLNIANELTAGLFAEAGLVRMVPSYDLNWRQMRAMLTHFDPSRFEVVVHQHMPMFHMEHCVFAHTLSTGRDFHDCGRPCERHQVDLRDRVGESHPVIPDVGCRNTVYNAQAQSGAEFIPDMLQVGLVNFRVELLRQGADQVLPLLQHYIRAIRGELDSRGALRSLKVISRLGVTSGTLDRE